MKFCNMSVTDDPHGVTRQVEYISSSPHTHSTLISYCSKILDHVCSLYSSCSKCIAKRGTIRFRSRERKINFSFFSNTFTSPNGIMRRSNKDSSLRQKNTKLSTKHFSMKYQYIKCHMIKS